MQRIEVLCKNEKKKKDLQSSSKKRRTHSQPSCGEGFLLSGWAAYFYSLLFRHPSRSHSSPIRLLLRDLRCCASLHSSSSDKCPVLLALSPRSDVFLSLSHCGNSIVFLVLLRAPLVYTLLFELLFGTPCALTSPLVLLTTSVMLCHIRRCHHPAVD